MTTIDFSSVTEKNVKEYTGIIRQKYKNLVEIIVENEEYYKKDTDCIVFDNIDKNNNFDSPHNNGLIGTIIYAYSNHIPLTLKPDDVWFAIILNFSRYVNKNSKELKNLFVDHEGKIDLKVAVDTPVIENINDNGWKEYISTMCDNMNSYLKEDIKTLIAPSFTTTTDNDRLIASISFMNSMSNYFNYTFAYECGLSKLKLLGSLDDWVKLENKVIELKKYNQPIIDEWIDLLIPVLDEFINTFSGSCNQDFWQRICTSKSRGSGGEKKYGGWMFVFSPFDREGNYILRSEKEINKDGIYAIVKDGCIASCSCSVKCEFDALGNKFDIYLLGGLLSTGYNKTDNFINPTSGFIVIKKNEINLDFLLNTKFKNIKNKIIIKYIYFLLNRYNIPVDDATTKFYKLIFENIQNKCLEFNNRSCGDNDDYNIDNIKNKINIFHFIFNIFAFSKYHENINEYYNDSIYNDFNI